MPLIATGVGGYNNSAAKESIELAVSLNFNSIDTARDYGNFRGVAAALQMVSKPRSQLFITTKVPGCGVPTQGLQPPCESNTFAQAVDDISELGLTHVDLMLIHFPPLLNCGVLGHCDYVQQQWRALEHLYSEKKARAIGVSNYCETCLRCIGRNATMMPMVNQVEYHLGMGADPAGLHSYCASHGIVLEAYSPLAHGKALGGSAVAAVAAAHKKSAAQAALAYVVQRGMPVVTRSSSALHLKADLDLWSWNLTTVEYASLDAVIDPACGTEAPGGCCHAHYGGGWRVTGRGPKSMPRPQSPGAMI